MRKGIGVVAGLVLLGVVAAGCATTKVEHPTSLKTSKAPVWSLTSDQSEMIVAVSPVRQSIQILGTTAALLGAGIDAIANDRDRKAIEAALHGYDAGKVFEDCLQKRLEEAVPNIKRVPPVGTTAGKQSLAQVEKARYAALAKKGADTLLDLKMTYGLFGYEGLLVTKLQGTLKLLPGGKRLWSDTIVVSAAPILARDRLGNPTNTLAPNLSSPRFSASKDAISKWTGDGGKMVRARFQKAVNGVVSALLCDLGVAQDAVGEYYLGKAAMNRKRFVEANRYFENALKLDPTMVNAANGQAVNLAHNKQVDQAIQMERAIAAAHPNYGPAWFNLAWWYAVDKKDATQAKACYAKARTLDMPADRRIDKFIRK